MIKTQIQVPEKQYADLRAFAAEREWSLAETFRRGAELLLEVYPRQTNKADGTWTPPSASEAGWMGLDATQLKDALAEDFEPQRKSQL